MCENDFANLETLEMHLKTCEIYKCRYCQKRETSISAIKEHFKEHTYIDHSGMLDHIKISRKDQNKVTEKLYWGNEL